jgi:hypothetical protein
MAGVDLSSGLGPEVERVWLEQPPGEAAFGENHAVWLHDQASGLQINGHINTCEDLGAYAQRLTKLYVSLPDGRVLLTRETSGDSTEKTAVGGAFRLEYGRPFEALGCVYDGVMQDVTVTRNFVSAAPLDYPRMPVRFEVETEMIAPAYIQGELRDGGLGPVKAFMGGRRYEQQLRCRGRITIGREIIPIEGFGVRTHRWGVRELHGSASAPRMLGHIWSTASFPSGAGFGLHAFPTADGGVLWSEGHVVRDGVLVPAKPLRATWLGSYRPSGETYELALQTKDGQVFEITGRTLNAVVAQMLPGAAPGEQAPIFQACTRYEMGGETAIGMLERSLRRSAIETGVGRPDDDAVAAPQT